MWINWSGSGNASREDWAQYFENYSGSATNNIQSTTQSTGFSQTVPQYTLPTDNHVAGVDQLKALVKNTQVNTNGDDTLDLDELMRAHDELSNYLNQRALIGLTPADVALAQQLNTINFLTDINGSNGKTNFEVLAGGNESIAFDPLVFSDITSKFGTSIDQTEINKLNIKVDEFDNKAIDTLFKQGKTLGASDLKELVADDTDVKPWEDGYELSQQIKSLAQLLLDNFDKVAATDEFGEDAAHKEISRDEIDTLLAKAGSKTALSKSDVDQLSSEIKQRTVSLTGIKDVFEAAGVDEADAKTQRETLKDYLDDLKADLLDDPQNADKSKTYRQGKALLDNWDLLTLATGDAAVTVADLEQYFSSKGELNQNKIKDKVMANYDSLYGTLADFYGQNKFTVSELQGILNAPPTVTVEIPLPFQQYNETIEQPVLSSDELKQLADMVKYLQLTDFKGSVNQDSF